MARPVDYRKTRGSKGVHTEDEHLPIGKSGQAREVVAKDQKADIPTGGRRGQDSKGKHSMGHVGQKAKSLAR